ncbi:peptidoglycan-binding protein LysM [Psychrobacter sp.]|uniref:peptidoglycan-binding protein LysM n=1 Tax=Psychrobacter sp. TaxID=56811 RepID=UPI0026473480|nr:peptidoglycan-binding protein LysM [Psychrobacter sp.]MDN6275500.1 peptidoglycan-binding protein LysM [Psychrobacter sp.]MDN6307517.1 peptidoglycan-binding protein LysM [Psychrobacter sp.]
MGMFSFAKDIGDKIFNRDDAESETQADANTPAKTDEPSAQSVANILLSRIQQQNLDISDLKIKYNGSTDTAEISGKAKTQADREKAIIAIGNVQNVAKVIDNIDIEEDAPESTMYTVKSGDSLSKIAQDVYGSANDYMTIFEANKPMLSDPDKIYPGQVLRIPKP